MMARKKESCACCMANQRRVGGWTYVVPRKSSMVSQVTELNHQEFTISSSRRSDSSRSNTGSSSGGGGGGGFDEMLTRC